MRARAVAAGAWRSRMLMGISTCDMPIESLTLVEAKPEGYTEKGFFHIYFTRDFSKADAVTVFFYPHLMERLIPQFNKLKPGARIISHQFEMPDVQPERVVVMDSKETGEKHRILKWITPLKREAKGLE